MKRQPGETRPAPVRSKAPTAGISGYRRLPQDPEAEQAVLGCILLNNDVLPDVIDRINTADFYISDYREIYTAILELVERGRPVDPLTLADELGRAGRFEALGGDETLSGILACVPHAVNARHYADIVRQKAISRELIEAAAAVQQDGYDDQERPEDLLARAEHRILGIADKRIRNDLVSADVAIADAIARSHRRSQGHETSGISTGYFELDEMLDGLHAGQLIIVASRPSMGKTAVATGLADHAAIQGRHSTLLVSLEMNRVELAERMIVARSGVDGHRFKSGFLEHKHRDAINVAFEQFRGAPILIDDSPSRSVLHIGAAARRVKQRQGLKLLVVDYLQLVDPDDPRDSRQEQVAKMSRRLKLLARELGVPIVLLSQLNRQVEKRENQRPRMADLRESGAIEQDADVVLLLHRPEYYDPNDQPGCAELIVAKNRNGATGTVKLVFLKNVARFDNLAQNLDQAAIDSGNF